MGSLVVAPVVVHRVHPLIAFVHQTMAARGALVAGTVDDCSRQEGRASWQQDFREHRTTHTAAGCARTSESV